MAKPGRFIQTTLLYEDKAASFVFVEGLDQVALAELDTHGLIRPVPFARIYARTSTVRLVACSCRRARMPSPWLQN